jgi:hypothetical protein
MYLYKDTDFLLHLPNNLSGDFQKPHGVSEIICTKEKIFCTKSNWNLYKTAEKRADG